MVTTQPGPRPPAETAEARIAKALAHPLRASILQRLGERVASPHDLALELGAPLGVVSYHVRMLRDYECVELVRTEPRRGALQHFYRAAARPMLDADRWRTPPSGLHPELSGETIAAVVDDRVRRLRPARWTIPR
jgi:DNA-binding transcriptional ArsR family regulator